ncbi:hypothetical protein C0993_004473 [Termitomyces sp. T159_Od127]|nr:hypothetical protein C0993_004473 [Termitomyces sp. T159_Od127]
MLRHSVQVAEDALDDLEGRSGRVDRVGVGATVAGWLAVAAGHVRSRLGGRRGMRERDAYWRDSFNPRRFHPAWGSLAHDYLSIMASSVSSERAFSQGGLTITKQQNRLKGDIVEALQCLKCAIRHDLLFREPGPSSVYETELEKLESNEDGKLEGEEEGWDGLLSDAAEDEDSFDVDMTIDLDSD